MWTWTVCMSSSEALLDYFHGPAKELRGELVTEMSFKKIGEKMEAAVREYKAGFVAAAPRGSR